MAKNTASKSIFMKTILQEEWASELHVKLVLTEEALGMTPQSTEIFTDYIASKAPNVESMEEEIEQNGVDETVKQGTTCFMRDNDGVPILWDYQIKGFFKDSLAALRKISGSKAKGLTAYKKVVDGMIHVEPRKIRIDTAGWKKLIEEHGDEIPEEVKAAWTTTEMGVCQRPLRAQTPQGERTALASSETVPAGSVIEFTVKVGSKEYVEPIKECFSYGALRGIGQWRNSGKGRFLCIMEESAKKEETEGEEAEAPKSGRGRPRKAV